MLLFATVLGNIDEILRNDRNGITLRNKMSRDGKITIHEDR